MCLTSAERAGPQVLLFETFSCFCLWEKHLPLNTKGIQALRRCLRIDISAWIPLKHVKSNLFKSKLWSLSWHHIWFFLWTLLFLRVGRTFFFVSLTPPFSPLSSSKWLSFLIFLAPVSFPIPIHFLADTRSAKHRHSCNTLSAEVTLRRGLLQNNLVFDSVNLHFS